MRLILTVVVLAIFHSGMSQDKIRINGRNVSGKVLGLDGEHISFQTENGDTIFLTKRDFVVTLKQQRSRIKYQLQLESSSEDSRDFNMDMGKRRFFAHTDFGITVRNTPQAIVKPGLSGSILYRALPGLHLGPGVGFDGFDDVNFTPVFFKISGNLPYEHFTPYLEINTGYSYATSKEETTNNDQLKPKAEGGLRFHPQLGFKIQEKYGTTFTFGLLYQKLTKESGFIDWRGNPNIITEKLKLNMLTFRIGFVF